MDEQQALQLVEQELDAALGRVVAPPQLGAAVMRKVQSSRITVLPEMLDAIGWLSVLAVVAILVAQFVPDSSPYWTWIVAIAFLTPALLAGWRSLRESPE